MNIRSIPLKLEKYAAQRGIRVTWNITHKIDAIELDHMITYQWPLKFDLQNASMEINLKTFLTQKLSSIQ